MPGAPAYVRNGRGDILAANRLGHALFSEMYVGPTRPANTARFVFLDGRAASFFVDWERVANEVVATLRSEAGRDPYDRGLSDLVGELSTQSETSRTRWAAHNVRFHDAGVKRIQHPVVGDLTLTYETMELSADAGLTVAVHTAEPGSRSEEALNLLGSWAASSIGRRRPTRRTNLDRRLSARIHHPDKRKEGRYSDLLRAFNLAETTMALDADLPMMPMGSLGRARVSANMQPTVRRQSRRLQGPGPHPPPKVRVRKQQSGGRP
jgi:hypothetical protein